MNHSPHSDTTTEGIRVYAAAEYLPQEVLPQEFLAAASSRPSFVFRYKITMTNVGSAPARLVSRHWVIVDGEGRREEVRGRGVVGEFPQLAPGQSYSYVSYCPLSTSWGTMEGSYTFERPNAAERGADERAGTRFQVRIGRFFLVPTAPRLELESESTI